MSDVPLRHAIELIEAAPAGGVIVHTVFDEATFTATHLVSDPATRKAAIIDSVLDFDPASGRTSHTSADT